MTGGTRTPTWKERENNKCRERRRRAVAAKIFTGLRLHGNFTLPKHCDNNEVLKALCFQAGWTVEPDGTTYRRGSKPVHNMGMMGGGSGSGSRPGSACSYQQSPSTSSYNPSPAADADATPLIPWLRSLTSSAASSSTFAHHHPHGGSISAPVTPPSASPTADWDGSYARLDWGGSSYPFLPFSTPPSPGPRPWYPGARIPQSGSTSPTFSLLSSNPRSGSLVCTPERQSGTCSPAVAISDAVNIPNIGGKNTSLVKPWEGETIHEECGSDELELTLGSSKPR